MCLQNTNRNGITAVLKVLLQCKFLCVCVKTVCLFQFHYKSRKVVEFVFQTYQPNMHKPIFFNSAYFRRRGYTSHLSQIHSLFHFIKSNMTIMHYTFVLLKNCLHFEILFLFSPKLSMSISKSSSFLLFSLTKHYICPLLQVHNSAPVINVVLLSLTRSGDKIKHNICHYFFSIPFMVPSHTVRTITINQRPYTYQQCSDHRYL